MTAIPAAIRPLAILAMCVLITAAGCAKKPKVDVTPTNTPTNTDTGNNGGTDNGTPEPTHQDPPKAAENIQDVFFDYDRFSLSDEAREVLNANGKILLETARLRYVLEGHCDERGTVEYNLALGEKRANAAKDYLVRYGVESSQLSTVSFGEERPFDPGHDEVAWESNRRVHFARQ